jgi:hypothetical protein
MQRGVKIRTTLRLAASASAILAAAQGCTPGGTHPGTLVGTYTIRGVLAENTCGESGFPTANPLSYDVEIREDDGLGYWMPSKQAQNTGSFNSAGAFHFTTSQTQVLSMGLANPNPQPSDFVTQGPDFDIQQKTCAVTIDETIDGTIAKRDAADGGMVTVVSAADGGSANSDSDLIGEDLIVVTPSSGSDCNMDLTAFGGAYLTLPCDARYEMTGTLKATAD